jgi:PilZ domain-containing protein
MQTGRVDRRMATQVAANLETLDEPSIRETVSIEDISAHGARVLTGRRWQPHERVIVSRVFDGFRTMAEVIYCRSVDEKSCVIGLKFSEPMDQLSIEKSSR